jgi:hypothetical protein
VFLTLLGANPGLAVTLSAPSVLLDERTSTGGAEVRSANDCYLLRPGPEVVVVVFAVLPCFTCPRGPLTVVVVSPWLPGLLRVLAVFPLLPCVEVLVAAKPLLFPEVVCADAGNVNASTASAAAPVIISFIFSLRQKRRLARSRQLQVNCQLTTPRA